MLHIGIDRALDGAACLQFFQMLNQQIRIKGGGVVIIDSGALLRRLAVLPLIVAVVSDDGDLRAEMLLQMAGEGGFAGAGAAGNADKDGAHKQTS